MGEWNVANFSKIIRPIRAIRVKNSSVEDSRIAITYKFTTA